MRLKGAESQLDRASQLPVRKPTLVEKAKSSFVWVFFSLPGGNAVAQLATIRLFLFAIGSYGGHVLSLVSSASRLESGPSAV